LFSFVSLHFFRHCSSPYNDILKFVCACDLCAHTRSDHMRNWVGIAFACCVGLFGSQEAFSHFRSCDVRLWHLFYVSWHIV
jgi:hypothetical protein